MLEAAEQIFSEKGYDGTRVDDIAERAGVNKAHLYYYFESKEDILKSLIEARVHESAELIEKPFSDASLFNEHTFSEMVSTVFENLSKRGSILKIVTMEAMKSNSNDNSIFKMIEPFVQKALESIVKIGLDSEEKNMHLLVQHFFFDMGPLLLFFSLRKKFAEYYNFDEAELETVFRGIYKGNMLKYSESISNKLKKQKSRKI